MDYLTFFGQAIASFLEGGYPNKVEALARKRALALVKMDLCCRQSDVAKITKLVFCEAGVTVTITGAKQLHNEKGELVRFIPSFPDPAICTVTALKAYFKLRPPTRWTRTPDEKENEVVGEEAHEEFIQPFWRASQSASNQSTSISANTIKKRCAIAVYRIRKSSYGRGRAMDIRQRLSFS